MASEHDMLDQLSPDENIYINAADGLTNDHPAMPESDDDSDGRRSSSDRAKDANEADAFDDLPTSLNVTNIALDVFADDSAKAEIEELFKFFSPAVKFQWLRSFRRLRVHFDTARAAASARIQLHQYQIGKSLISCYFAQPVTPVANKFLRPPAPYKNFLISPPSSPPAGWEPREEGEPLVNHDLLAALANLTPGEIHELHPPSSDHPGIVVHTAIRAEAGDDEGDAEAAQQDNDENDPPNKMPMGVHTRCPERKTST